MIYLDESSFLPLAFSVSWTNETAVGANDGTFTVLGSGGIPSYQYKLNAGAYQVSGSFTGLAPGTYTVTVKDSNNFTFSDTFIIYAMVDFTYVATGENPEGAGNGSIVITATGGRTPYLYSKDGGVTYQSSNTFSNLDNGTYEVYVKDYYNTTVHQTVVLSSFIVATGGTITTSGNFKIHTFTTDGTFEITSGTGTVEREVVAGGGAGGTGGGAGGGAGGRVSNSKSMTVGVFPVVVGTGGTVTAGNGNNGNNSTFDDITAVGGGGGGGSVGNGQNGGSGGGRGQFATSAGTGTVGQGNNGGLSTGNSSGGGGGAGAVGGNAPNTSTGGNGGAGLDSTIDGTARAGGGGGSGVGGSAGSGGNGGGGRGASFAEGSAVAGTDGTGGGGGGGYDGTKVAAKGGKGIVIVKYQYQ